MPILRTRRALALGAAIALAACGGAQNQEGAARRGEKGTGPVVIAAPWPWEARKGIRYGEGMQLAIDEINAAGGVHGRPVQLLRVDDHEDLDRGRIVAQEVSANPDVVAVIGHLQSYVTIPAAAAYDLAGLVLVAPTATSAELTRLGHRRLFRATLSDVAVGREMAQYATRQGYRRIAIYYSRDEYGRELANSFEENVRTGGAQVLDRRSYDPSVAASPVAAAQAADAWKDMAPDAVFVAGDGDSGAILARALRERGISAPLLGGDALAIPTYLQRGGAAVEGTVIASRFSIDTPTPEVQRFASTFRKRFGADPDVGAALGYDAVRVLTHAMTQAPSVAPDQVATALRGVRGLPLVTGTFSFDASGELVDSPIRKVVVKGGAFRHLPEGIAGAGTERGAP